MPVLKIARHEKFAQALAKGKTADETYVDAGIMANRGNAARLNAKESVQKRVEEITSRVAEKAEWTAADTRNRRVTLPRIDEFVRGGLPRPRASLPQASTFD